MAQVKVNRVLICHILLVPIAGAIILAGMVVGDEVGVNKSNGNAPVANGNYLFDGVSLSHAFHQQVINSLWTLKIPRSFIYYYPDKSGNYMAEK